MGKGLESFLGQAVQMQPQQVQAQLATPFNDIQLLALMATQILGVGDYMTPTLAVEKAKEVFIEAILAGPSLGVELEAKRKLRG